jgi:repressor LexA
MTLGEYIRLYRAEHGLSQREFVERCGGGITHGYISIIEKGVNPNTGKASRPSLDKLYAIARGMGMSVSDLAKKVEDFGDAASIVAESTVPPRPTNALPYTPSRSMVAVVGSVRCGPGGALAYTDLQGAEMADVSDPSEYFYLRAVGDSMEPRIYAGDLILVHAQPEVESGDLAVVIIDEDEGVLKRFIERDGAIILQSYNPEYPPRVFVGSEKSRLRVAGRAVQMVRKW